MTEEKREVKPDNDYPHLCLRLKDEIVSLKKELVSIRYYFLNEVAVYEKERLVLQALNKELLEACNKVMSLDTSGALEAMAYTGGDVPKKWLREEAPALTARAKARKEIQDILRVAITHAEVAK